MGMPGLIVGRAGETGGTVNTGDTISVHVIIWDTMRPPESSGSLRMCTRLTREEAIAAGSEFMEIDSRFAPLILYDKPNQRMEPFVLEGGNAKWQYHIAAKLLDRKGLLSGYPLLKPHLEGPNE